MQRDPFMLEANGEAPGFQTAALLLAQNGMPDLEASANCTIPFLHLTMRMSSTGVLLGRRTSFQPLVLL